MGYILNKLSKEETIQQYLDKGIPRENIIYYEHPCFIYNDKKYYTKTYNFINIGNIKDNKLLITNSEIVNSDKDYRYYRYTILN